jgi:acetyl esterase/lipase
MAARPATFLDKLSLVGPVVAGLPVGLFRLATRPFTNDVKPQTAYKDFVYAVFRHVLARVTITQEKWLTVPTEKTYLTWAEKKNLPTDTAVLSSGLKVHWIGNHSSEKVFLYFHGGGYVNPVTPEHLDWLLELQTDLSHKKSVAVAVVGYTCAPEGQYPVQLREAAESLLWLLTVQGKKPEDVSHQSLLEHMRRRVD